MKMFKLFLATMLFTTQVNAAWTQATSRVIAADNVSGVNSMPNFIKQGDAEVVITGVSTYDEGSAVDRPVDCTGGVSGITFARDSSSPISDKYSWVLTKGGGTSRMGQGAAIDFTVDSNVSGVKMMQILGDMKVSSGTFAAWDGTTATAESDVIYYLYDVTAGRLVEPSSFRFTSNTVNALNGFVQSTSGSTQYRLCLHIATNSSSDYTLKFDNLAFKQSNVLMGSIITDWQSYTPTLTFGSGSTSATLTYNCAWRRVADTGEYACTITFGAGTIGTWSEPRVPLPTGHVATGSSSIPSSLTASNTCSVVVGGIIYPGVPNASSVNDYYCDVVLVDVHAGNAPGKLTTITQAFPATFASGSQLRFYSTRKIVGWSSGAQLADGYDGREISARYTALSTGGVPDTMTIFDFGTKTFDTTSSVTTGASWNFRVPSSGTYEVTYKIPFTSPAGANRCDARVRRNTTVYHESFRTTTAAVVDTLVGSTLIQAVAGDTIDLLTMESGALGASFANTQEITIKKLSGSAFMSPTATWASHYSGNAGDTITSSGNIIKFTNRIDDTYGSYTPSTGRWLADKSGKCSASWRLSTAPVTLSTSQRFTTLLYKNGTLFKNGSNSNGNGASIAQASVGSVLDIPIVAGDYLEIYGLIDVSTTASTQNEAVYFTVDCKQ